LAELVFAIVVAVYKGTVSCFLILICIAI